MNISQARKIPIGELLDRMGIVPARRTEQDVWYASPLRQENTASFKVNQRLNLWYDFGAGEGGTIIDLAMKLGKTNTIPEALAFIEETLGGRIAATPFVKTSVEPSTPALELLHSCPIRNHMLRTYLKQRGIDQAVANQQVEQVYYRSQAGDFVAIGFANDAGGFEIRSPNFKGSIGRKSISSRIHDPNIIAIFEGFFDYLTYLQQHGSNAESAIILNSVALKEQAVARLKELSPTRIDVYRDRDATGEALYRYIVEQLPDIACHDLSDRYAPHKDLNEFHIASKAKQHDTSGPSIT